jgi:outer membrane lipoprotein-sorting protein
MKTMKKILFLLLLATLFCISCNRALTPYEAANNHYGHCRDIK